MLVLYLAAPTNKHVCPFSFPPSLLSFSPLACASLFVIGWETPHPPTTFCMRKSVLQVTPTAPACHSKHSPSTHHPKALAVFLLEEISKFLFPVWWPPCHNNHSQSESLPKELSFQATPLQKWLRKPEKEGENDGLLKEAVSGWGVSCPSCFHHPRPHSHTHIHTHALGVSAPTMCRRWYKDHHLAESSKWWDGIKQSVKAQTYCKHMQTG